MSESSVRWTWIPPPQPCIYTAADTHTALTIASTGGVPRGRGHLTHCHADLCCHHDISLLSHRPLLSIIVLKGVEVVSQLVDCPALLLEFLEQLTLLKRLYSIKRESE